MQVNAQQKLRLLDKLNSVLWNLSGKKIALCGLAFKPYTDDILEAPSLYNIDALLKEGASVASYDPEAISNVRKVVGDKIEYVDHEYDVLKDADALMIMTEWPVFRTPEFDRIKANLNNPLIFDGRNLYSPQKMKDRGFEYYSIGRNK